jgi:2'-hydroxyisoflavone reductase
MNEPLRLLILGGTAFLGPETIAAAIAKGAEITVFNRGKTNPELFAKRGWKVTELRGDRDPKVGDGLKALEEAIAKGARWDGVIDNSAYVPRVAAASAELLKDAAKQYVFVSTISVYTDNSVAPSEETPPGTLPDPSIEQVSGLSYGPLKAYCEEAVRKAFGDRASIVRPGLIVGPGDPTNRFTYWPVRLDRGGKTILPVAPKPWESLVQWIDVRDLAEWLVRLVIDGHGGTYNAVGPDGPMSFQEFVFGCRAATASPVEFVPIDESFLLEQQVGPWMEMPLWVPGGPDSFGIGRAANRRAIGAGLTFRPLATTAADTIAWFREGHGGTTANYDFGGKDARGRPDAGLAKAKEAAVIEAWLQRTPAASP